jgi:diadenosine tetraphosphate (Ap4A) HIT family hydrolase
MTRKTEFAPTVSQKAFVSQKSADYVQDCALCNGDDGTLVIMRSARLRIVRVLDKQHPVYYRVIWNAHVQEFTDLAPKERQEMMTYVALVEEAIRGVLVGKYAPTKINLASLGNQVPHLHWHVIARYDWDTHYPEPIWGEKQRAPDLPRLALLVGQISQIDLRLAS